MKYSWIIVIFFWLGCSSSENKSSSGKSINEESSVDDIPKIKDYIKNFKVLRLPFKTGIHLGIKTDSLPKIGYEIPGETAEYEEYFCYGLLPDTSKFYSVIVLYSTDIMVPALKVYSKKGEFISSEFLVQRGCQADCGSIFCSAWLEIDPDQNMTLTDTLDYRICDEKGEETNERHHFILKTQIKVDESGRIRYSEGERTDLK